MRRKLFRLPLFLLSVLSFKLKINEIKFCLDRINRERLNFSFFDSFRVELFHSGRADNYSVQMQLSGL